MTLLRAQHYDRCMSSPTPVVYPTRHVRVDTAPGSPTWGALELAAPLALGQRVLIIGEPRSGATTVLQHIARSMLTEVANVDVHALLVDREVEERLDWTYELPEVTLHGTTSDMDVTAHADVAHVFENALAAAAGGRDVVLLVDSFTALARACNVVAPPDDRVLTGGIQQAALIQVRRWFGSARAFADNGGSLTVAGSAAVATGAEADDLICEELIGTGTMDIRLDIELHRAGLLPAIDLDRSGARHDELILGDDETARRATATTRLLEGGPADALARVLTGLEEHYSLETVIDHALRNSV